MDSWSRWTFHTSLGVIIGMTSVTDGIYIYFLREASDGSIWAVADFQPTALGFNGMPYLDSNRPYSQVTSGTGSVTLTSGNEWIMAFSGPVGVGLRRLLGTPISGAVAMVAAYPSEPNPVVGALNDAYFTPTNPFMRDGKGKAIMSGRLTITKLLVGFKNSTGFRWILSKNNVAGDPIDFNGRILGDPNNLIGVEPVSTGQQSIPIGSETRHYSLSIYARRWYPFTVTALEWVGQFFNRVQRF
jgi:hypothetical protein